MSMSIFELTLLATTLSCALVAGLVFGFASVVMPGISKLPDKDFLLAFKHMDGIIQDNQPAFMLVWVGSIVSTILMLVFGTEQLSGGQLYLMWFASGLYLLAVQAPTIRFNIPLNNAIQALHIESLSETELTKARAEFEGPWNWWNRFRTITSILSVVALLVLQWMLR